MRSRNFIFIFALLLVVLSVGFVNAADPVCGDGACNGDETQSNCPRDCGCAQADACLVGDGDPVCGDGACNYGETYLTCATDCSCGDGACNGDEDYQSCSADCTSVSSCTDDGLCQDDEDVTCDDCYNSANCLELDEICDRAGGENIINCAADCGIGAVATATWWDSTGYTDVTYVSGGDTVGAHFTVLQDDDNEKEGIVILNNLDLSGIGDQTVAEIYFYIDGQYLTETTLFDLSGAETSVTANWEVNKGSIDDTDGESTITVEFYNYFTGTIEFSEYMLATKDQSVICDLSSATMSWSPTDVSFNEGSSTSSTATVSGISGCGGLEATFGIYEYDGGGAGDDFIETITGTVSDGSVSSAFTINTGVITSSKEAEPYPLGFTVKTFSVGGQTDSFSSQVTATMIETDDPVCGNGDLEGLEECDDGNLIDDDGCSSTCAIESSICGNGVIEGGEGCDDGGIIGGDGCSARCTLEVETPECGNGNIEGEEDCDDGNTDKGDGCSDVCTTETQLCGNGIRETEEGCDDGNTDNGDGCSDVCIIEATATCGNDIIETGEECDDGGIIGGDGCSASCQFDTDIGSINFEWRDSLGTAWIDDYTMGESNVTTFKIYIENIVNPYVGRNLNIEIKEKDTGFDDDITSVTAVMQADGTAMGTFITSNQVFEDARAGPSDSDNDYEFYFIVSYDGQSESSKGIDELEVFIEDTETCEVFVLNGNLCADYEDSGQCNADTCGVNESSGTAVGINCLLEGIDCYCEWNVTEAACGFEFDVTDPEGNVIGSCDYDEDRSGDENECADGFLSYTWTGTWTWDLENPGFPTSQGENYVQDPTDSLWYFDPLGYSTSCVDGQNTIACPAKVQLSGFNWVNLIVALVIIGIIYGLFEWDKKKKKSKAGKKKVKAKKSKK
jgi:cysteine-rich repeat protein